MTNRTSHLDVRKPSVRHCWIHSSKKSINQASRLPDTPELISTSVILSCESLSKAFLKQVDLSNSNQKPLIIQKFDFGPRRLIFKIPDPILEHIKSRVNTNLRYINLNCLKDHCCHIKRKCFFIFFFLISFFKCRQGIEIKPMKHDY